MLGEHRVIHVMLSVKFDQVGNRDDFFAQGAISSVLLLLVKIGLGRVLVEKEAEKRGVFLKDLPHAVLLPVFFGPIEVNQHVLLTSGARCVD